MLAWKKKKEAKFQCQCCGIITDKLAVHHIRPIEDARTWEDKEERCFSEDNLEVLCYSCHKNRHRNRVCRTREQLKKDRINDMKQAQDELRLTDALDI